MTSPPGSRFSRQSGGKASQVNHLLKHFQKGSPATSPPGHRVISNLKVWLRGTNRGVSERQLQAYLDEFVFRFNRRRAPMAAFQTWLGIGASLPPTTYRGIKEGAFALGEQSG